MKPERIGRFALSMNTVRHDPDTARAIMGMCIVVRCEMMFASDTLEYIAVSPYFDEARDGYVLPTYNVLISDGGKTIKFERCK